jgi:hypothetical protein
VVELHPAICTEIYSTILFQVKQKVALDQGWCMTVMERSQGLGWDLKGLDKVK